ncbi:MAG TPA: cytochrome P450 [Tepidisphaeraceae bacterium]|jgi:cytochrome P450|nr:cytochrome P450 [Tepidisphaeraceae bacterium]
MSQRRSPPGPWNPPLTSLWRQRDLLRFLLRIGSQYGDLWRFRVGRRNYYVLNHPDHIRQVLIADASKFIKGPAIRNARITLGDGLLSSEGDLHKQQRRLITPVFHPTRVATYAERMVQCAETMCAHWTDGQVIDLHQRMTALTLDVVTQVLFGGEIGTDVGRIGAAMHVLVNMFDRARNPLAPLLNKLPLPSNFRFLRALREVEATLQGFIENKKRGNRDPKNPPDLLELLLATGGMSDKQLRDEAVTLFTAGHETTANALVWTWYLLAQHPEAEQKFHEELDRVLGDRLARSEDLDHLPYTRMVLSESMRLYPPAWIVARQAVENYEIAGYPIAAGSVLLMSQYLIHRDPRFWGDDPTRFDPGRFTEDAKSQRPRWAYFPFGAGPRSCIGEGFAWVEAMLLLATIGRRWRLQLVDPHQTVHLHATITLRPENAIPMRLIRRNPPPGVASVTRVSILPRDADG